MTDRSILICEKDRSASLDLEVALQCMGYPAPSVTFTGEEAVGEVDKIDPTLIFMGIRLSGEMDGIQAAELIKLRHDVPIIYLSTEFDGSIFERAKSTRPGGYLIQPFSTPQLEASMQMALTFSNGRAECSGALNDKFSAKLSQTSLVPVTAAVPICSCCKQIRDDSGSWRHLEQYFTDKLGILFTHSLCPECLEEYRPLKSQG